MSLATLQITLRDPIVSRDGRPFGAGQGNRMHGLAWPLPSVVSGSFRSALVKVKPDIDFTGNLRERLMAIEVAGVFPVHDGRLYLPAPSDVILEPTQNGKAIKIIHRIVPQSVNGGCDLPHDLWPVMLSEKQGAEGFKPVPSPAWWPAEQMTQWLLGDSISFDTSFLGAPRQELREQVRIDARNGTAAEGNLFTTSGLNMTYLPRFGVNHDDTKIPLASRFARITLSARVTIPTNEAGFKHLSQLNIWCPLGGESRLVHWQHNGDVGLWSCPERVGQIVPQATQFRMVLATHAIFKDGWKPGWLNSELVGSPPNTNVKLKLVGVINGRWRAVSGWSLAPPRGPKPIRRMVPAGSVYFFQKLEGDPATLATCWLQSVCDDAQEQRDGFGLALWGIWDSRAT